MTEEASDRVEKSLNREVETKELYHGEEDRELEGSSEPEND